MSRPQRTVQSIRQVYRHVFCNSPDPTRVLSQTAILLLLATACYCWRLLATACYKTNANAPAASPLAAVMTRITPALTSDAAELTVPVAQWPESDVLHFHQNRARSRVPSRPGLVALTWFHSARAAWAAAHPRWVSAVAVAVSGSVVPAQVRA